ncbi:cytochrome P450 [Saonia flava]|uniref:Cytochrome P450 n=1 Tax=Saonia flava TaxID=523696 RepID=A0A846QPH1_9FLAO|nr:cytochrome P450 [Saonia flava]NJB70956.1 cytochrome P450 [Saonia flava]
MSKYKYPNKVPFYKFLINSSAFAKNPIPFQQRWFNEHQGSFYVKPLFGPPIVLTRDAVITKHILRKNHRIYHKSEIQTKYLSKYVGYGLLTSNGDYWLKQRRLIQPGFHREKLENLVSIIDSSIKEQVNKIETSKILDLYPIMNELAFEVVAKSLFNFSARRETLKRLQTIVEQLQKFIVKDIRQPHKKLLYILNGDIRYHMKLVKEGRGIINKVIEQRRQSADRHDDLLQMLLDAKYEDETSMSNDQLIDEILILFVAGHETTANALTFSLTLIAQNKEIRDKVEKEIENCKTKQSLLEKIGKLTLIKDCVQESMRLYPPVWITDRVAIEDDKIGTYHFKKGTMIGISIYELHRNIDFWKNPDQFMPERFSENEQLHKSEYYIPFGAGPRLCIGNNFAMFEMILTINEVLQKFEVVSETKEISINPLITLKPVGLKMKFKERGKK